ncbi:growth hormone secretagogue receptor type 1-like [Elysia marginata]|uniref:Growth hormone secretagogue receptor type 1-like n=1 Tax=Elysia marginata TaxID=1093978 RepID=A0AAV4J4X9_9GAST|nr:growth hormone secretagogue receptor type 1-like [Elysia marginata]
MSDELLEDEINRYLWLIVSPILLVIGSVGNVMSIAVMSRSNMRTSQASVYLIALSLADLVVLYTGLIRYFIKEVSGVDIRTLSAAGCRLHITMVYMSLDISVWILVAFTGERILSVFMPYKVKNICTRVTSLVMIATIVIIMLILNGHFLFGLAPVTITFGDNTTSRDVCTFASSEYEQFIVNVWPWIDFCVFNLVPFLLLSIGNTCIAVRVVISRRRAKKVGEPGANQRTLGINGLSAANSSLTREARATPETSRSLHMPAPTETVASNSQQPIITQRGIFHCAESLCVPPICGTKNVSVHGDVTANGANRLGRSEATSRASFKMTDQDPPIRTSARNDRTSSMTAILLLLNFVFLATTTPVSIYFIVQDSWHKRITTDKEYALHRLTFTVVNLIQYFNNSINFILYCITGSRFRKELQAMLFRRNRVFPLEEAARRRPRALEREITGLHTRMTVASDSNPDAQPQNPPSGNHLTVPRTKRSDTQL